MNPSCRIFMCQTVDVATICHNKCIKLIQNVVDVAPQLGSWQESFTKGWNRIFKLNRLPRHYHDSSARELVRKLISFVVSCLTTFSSLVPRSPLHGLVMRLYTPEHAYLVQETTGKAERYTWPVMQPFFWKATCVQHHAYRALQFSGWLHAVIAVKVTLADILLLAAKSIQVGQIETWFVHFAHGQQKFRGFNFHEWLRTCERHKSKSFTKIANHMVLLEKCVTWIIYHFNPTQNR